MSMNTQKTVTVNMRHINWSVNWWMKRGKILTPTISYLNIFGSMTKFIEKGAILSFILGYLKQQGYGRSVMKLFKKSTSS